MIAPTHLRLNFHQSVKGILIEHGFDLGPKRGKGTWSEFLEMHKETFVALALNDAPCRTFAYASER